MVGAAQRRAQNRQEMRGAILAEAGRLLSEEGAAAVSVRAIARALGYSPAGLYEYFRSKDDILAALYFEGMGGLRDQMTEALAKLPPDASAVDTLRVLGRTYRSYARSQPELFRLVAAGEEATFSHHQKDYEQQESAGMDVLMAAIERGIEQGDFLRRPVMELAFFCWSVVHGFVVLDLDGHMGEADRDALFEQLLHYTVRGIQSIPESIPDR